MSTMYVNNVAPLDTNIDSVHIPGHVVQTVVIRGGETQYTTGNNNILAAAITPKYSNSKIIVNCGSQIHTDASNNSYWMLTLRREIAGNEGSLVNIGNAVGYQKSGGERDVYSTVYQDSPGVTSQVYYRVRLEHNSGSDSIRVNYSGNGWIYLQEIAQ